VLLPYQVLPDVIVSITPHTVVVKRYYNGWLRDYPMPLIIAYSFNGPKFIQNGILNSPVNGSEA
jgi:hypothetical protein